MKIAHISTINSLEQISSKGDIEFCLAPYCKNEDYKKYFKSSRKFIILDNGVAEDILISDEDLVELALSMLVDELIIPDVIGDYKKTKKMREKFMDKYYAKLNDAGIQIQSVVQGKTLKEYEECLKEISEDSRINTIGIPFRINYADFKGETKEQNNMSNRIFFILIFEFFKPIHCLGCNLPEEFEVLKHMKIRSIDSKLMARYGLNMKIFNFNDKEKSKKKLFVDKDLNDAQIKCAIKNIKKLKESLK